MSERPAAPPRKEQVKTFLSARWSCTRALSGAPERWLFEIVASPCVSHAPTRRGGMKSLKKGYFWTFKGNPMLYDVVACPRVDDHQ